MVRVRWDQILRTPPVTPTKKPQNPFDDDVTRERVASAVMLSLIVLSVISGLLAVAAIAELLIWNMEWPAWVAYPVAAVGLLVSRGLIAPLAIWGAMVAWSWPAWVATLVFIWPVLLQIVTWLGGFAAWVNAVRESSPAVAARDAANPSSAEITADIPVETEALPTVQTLGHAARCLLEKIDNQEKALIARGDMAALQSLYSDTIKRDDVSFYRDAVYAVDAAAIRVMMRHRLDILNKDPLAPKPDPVIEADPAPPEPAVVGKGLGINGWVASFVGAQLIAGIAGFGTLLAAGRGADLGMAGLVGFAAFVLGFLVLAPIRKKMDQSVRWFILGAALVLAIMIGPQAIGGMVWPVLVQVICWALGKDRV